MASDEELGTGSVRITFDDSTAVASAESLGDRLEAILDRASRDAGLRIQRNIARAVRAASPQRIRFEADLRPLEHSLNTLNNLEPVSLPTTPDVDRAEFEAAIEAALSGLEVSVRVTADLDELDAAIRAHNAPTVNVDVDRSGIDAATGSISRLGVVVRGLGASLGSLGGVAAFGGLVADIKNLSGAAAALPAVIGAAGVALGTLKLATAGLGEAFGTALTGSADEFTKALEGMTPAAQAAATEIRGLKPGFDALKASVQSAFLAPLAGDFARLGEALSPLQGRMNALAGEFGGIASEALKVGSSASFIDSLKTSFDAMTPAVAALKGFVEPLGQAFAEMSTGVTEAFGGQLTSSIESAAKSFRNFVDTADLGARAVDSIRGAGAVFQSIGEVASNLGGIFSGIFGAAETAGVQSFTGILGTLLGVLNEFVNSAPVQGALQAIFQAFSAVLPVVGQLASSVGSILGPALQAVAEAALPVVEVLGGAFSAVLPILTGAFKQLVAALTPVVSLIGTTLAQVLEAAAPLLVTLARVFAQVAAAVAPLIAQVASALIPLFAALTPAIDQIVAAVTPLIEQLIASLLPVLPPIIDAFTAILGAVVPLIPVVANLVAGIAPLVSLLISALAPVIQFGAEIVKWLAINAVVPVIQGVISVVSSIVGAVTTVIAGVSGFVTSVVGFFTNLNVNVTSLVTGLISSVVGSFLSLPGRAAAALAPLVASVASVVNSAKNAVTSRVSSLVSSAVALVRGLPDKARAALSGISGALTSAGGDLIRGFISGIRNAAADVAKAAVDAARAAVDGVKGFLGINSPSRVFAEIGNDTGQGFVVGFSGMVHRMRGAAVQAAKSVTDAFQGVRPTVDVRGASASPFSGPFRTGITAPGFDTVRPAGAVADSRSVSGPTIVNNFSITEVGDAEATAQRVVNRIATRLAL